MHPIQKLLARERDEECRILVGDCAGSMRGMPEKSVQCCVTSPPYFGLRNYNGGDAEIGKEKTPAEFVAALVAVFREVRRVLKDDGTVWLNLGDSYATQGGSRQLLGIPWRVAFALQDDGWILRQDIIWNKPNPMPEGARDRCTKAHEYIFLLVKKPKYFYNREAIKVKASQATLDRNKYGFSGAFKGQMQGDPREKRWQEGRPIEKPEFSKDGKANRRSVWTVTTKPYKGAHFATFPPDLIEPCILAGSRPGDMVLDPFGGSGTTAQVALQHGRRVTLCELNPAYAVLARERIAKIHR